MTDTELWTGDALLADGAAVHLRPVAPGDGPALHELYCRLSEQSAAFAFGGRGPAVPPGGVGRFTPGSGHRRTAMVATLGSSLVAVASYEPTGDDAEVRFVVDEAHRGRGIATLLLEQLAALARAQGVRRLVASVPAGDELMLAVLNDAGFSEEASADDGGVRVCIQVEATEAAISAVEAREHGAAVRSLEAILRPRSIAVVGAGRRRGTIGHEIFRNLLAGGFAGPVFPVHPTATHVASVRAYPTILDVPADVDLAVVVVPGDQVLAVVEECAAKGVHGLVVISAGFAETGPDGASAEREVVLAARRAGMRLVGPNCMGVINTAPDVSMNATFAPVPPRPGRVAFLSQSGGLGIAVLEEAGRRDLGLSSFVSVGNKADVSGNDLLQYWEQDEATDVVLLYLESFGNPGRFARVARQVSRTKPIVAVKSGRTPAGSRAASSHTAALASPELAVDALFRQAGVIRVDTLEELFGVAQVLSTQPLPTGRRVAIVGNAGGPGILAADACEGAGLEVPELSSATQALLRSFLPATAGVRNPVDMIASASASDYERTLRAVLDDPSVDSVLALFTPPLVTEAADVARAVATAAAGASSKPVIASFLAMAGTPDALRSGRRTVPSFPFPEAAARALASACGYAEWRRRPPGRTPVIGGLSPDVARGIVSGALAGSPEGTWLDAVTASGVLNAYGIDVAPFERAGTADEAAAAAGRLGGPVVLKAASPELVHKSDVGGVRLGITSPGEAADAFRAMESELGDDMGGAVVQAMVPSGIETIVGVVQDPSFGPLVMFGTGGTTVELFGDRALRILPLTDTDVSELVRSLKGSPLLFGYRGSPPVDVASLEQLVLRVGRLAADLPEVAEMDLNPVIVSPAGATVVDVKIRVAPHRPTPDPSLRRLR